MSDITGIKQQTNKENPSLVSNRKLIGASVLPYGVDPSHNNIYFLLGAEKRIPRWSESSKWSDFGGSPKTGESPAETAGREFHEETCAAVKWDKSEGGDTQHFVRPNYLPVVNDLKKKNYTFKLITLIDEDRFYTTYVKQIPFDGSIHRRTSVLLNSLGKVRSEIRTNHAHEMNTYEKALVHDHPSVRLDANDQCIHVSRDYLEKQSVQWVSIPQLQDSINETSRTPLALRSGFKGRIQSILDEFESDPARLGSTKKISTNELKYNEDNHVQTIPFDFSTNMSEDRDGYGILRNGRNGETGEKFKCDSKATC